MPLRLCSPTERRQPRCLHLSAAGRAARRQAQSPSPEAVGGARWAACRFKAARNSAKQCEGCAAAKSATAIHNEILAPWAPNRCPNIIMFSFLLPLLLNLPDPQLGSSSRISFFKGPAGVAAQISRCARLRASSRCARLRRRAWAAGVRTPPTPLLRGSRIAFGRSGSASLSVGLYLSPQPKLGPVP